MFMRYNYIYNNNLEKVLHNEQIDHVSAGDVIQNMIEDDNNPSPNFDFTGFDWSEILSFVGQFSWRGKRLETLTLLNLPVPIEGDGNFIADQIQSLCTEQHLNDGFELVMSGAEDFPELEYLGYHKKADAVGLAG
jgi:hypothetical protein